MRTVVAMIVCAIFVALALWHVRMAFGDMRGDSGAVPSVDGKALFVPSRQSTLAVAFTLLLFAALVAAIAGILQVGISSTLLSWGGYALALGLAARAIGDFKYVGFFKRVRGSKFARLDTLLYSPLCLCLAVCVAVVASGDAI